MEIINAGLFKQIQCWGQTNPGKGTAPLLQRCKLQTANAPGFPQIRYVTAPPGTVEAISAIAKRHSDPMSVAIWEALRREELMAA